MSDARIHNDGRRGNKILESGVLADGGYYAVEPVDAVCRDAEWGIGRVETPGFDKFILLSGEGVRIFNGIDYLDHYTVFSVNNHRISPRYECFFIDAFDEEDRSVLKLRFHTVAGDADSEVNSRNGGDHLFAVA